MPEYKALKERACPILEEEDFVGKVELSDDETEKAAGGMTPARGILCAQWLMVIVTAINFTRRYVNITA